jgi:predicted  nucleic acid-binding Zn-ribbon protein
LITNKDEYNLTDAQVTEIRESKATAEDDLVTANKVVKNVTGELARAQQAMVKAAQVRAEMEEIDRLFREMDRAWRKIQTQEDQLWELQL